MIEPQLRLMAVPAVVAAVFGFCCNRLAARQQAVNQMYTANYVMSATPATALLARSLNWAERDAGGAQWHWSQQPAHDSEGDGSARAAHAGQHGRRADDRTGAYP